MWSLSCERKVIFVEFIRRKSDLEIQHMSEKELKYGFKSHGNKSLA